MAWPMIVTAVVAAANHVSNVKGMFRLKTKSLLGEVSSGFDDLSKTKQQIDKVTGTLSTGDYGTTLADYKSLAFDQIRSATESNMFDYTKEKRKLEQDLELSRDSIAQELTGLKAERSRLRKQDSFWENII